MGLLEVYHGMFLVNIERLGLSDRANIPIMPINGLNLFSDGSQFQLSGDAAAQIDGEFIEDRN